MQPVSAPTVSRDKATVAAAKQIFDALVRVGTAAVVFTGLAYYFGSRSLEAEYWAIGAGWYPKTLPFDRKVWSGLFAVLPLVGQLAVLLPNVARHDGLTAQQLRRLALWTWAVAAALALVAGYLPTWHLAALAAAVLFILSAGFTVFEIIVRLRDDEQDWTSYTIYLVYAGVFVALVQAPQQWGSAFGRIAAATGFSSSPSVELVGAPGKRWRLVDAAADSALIAMGPSESGFREYRIVKFDSIERVHSTQEPQGAAGSDKALLPVPAASAAASSASR